MEKLQSARRTALSPRLRALYRKPSPRIRTGASLGPGAQSAHAGGAV